MTGERRPPRASHVETERAINILLASERSLVRWMPEPLRYEVTDDDGKVTATVYVEPAGSLRLDGWPP